MTKYKYYFKKPRSEIAKDILKWLALTGVIYFATSSPYFVPNLIRSYKKWKRWKKYKRKKIYDAFYNLRRQGYINIEKKGQQIYISLTKEGRKKAGRFQIDSLKINKPKKWDNKWRVVIFDIAQFQKLKRNIFREKLKELGFYSLQKSVWVIPYQCKDEIELLRDFFGLTKKEIRLITAETIEDDAFLRKIFKI